VATHEEDSELAIFHILRKTAIRSLETLELRRLHFGLVNYYEILRNSYLSIHMDISVTII